MSLITRTPPRKSSSRLRQSHPSIDGKEFKVPIKQGGIVERVGRTSLRIRVEVNKEEPLDGSRDPCTVGYFTMVAVGEDGRPKPVPPEKDVK